MNVVEESEVTAFHEAGHGVAHSHFRHELAFIEMSRDGAYGNCRLSLDIPIKTSSEISQSLETEFLFQRVIALCAGGHAVQKLRQGEPGNCYERQDREKAFNICIELNDGDVEGAKRLLHWLERRSELLVERGWGDITRLSFALLEKGKLSGAEVENVIASSGSALASPV
jgi:hypothetical protein